MTIFRVIDGDIFCFINKASAEEALTYAKTKGASAEATAVEEKKSEENRKYFCWIWYSKSLGTSRQFHFPEVCFPSTREELMLRQLIRVSILIEILRLENSRNRPSTLDRLSEYRSWVSSDWGNIQTAIFYYDGKWREVPNVEADMPAGWWYKIADGNVYLRKEGEEEEKDNFVRICC